MKTSSPSDHMAASAKRGIDAAMDQARSQVVGRTTPDARPEAPHVADRAAPAARPSPARPGGIA